VIGFPQIDPPKVIISTTEISVFGGIVTGGGSYDPDSMVTLVAKERPGFVFSRWSGGATGNSNPLIITATSDTSISANFIIDSKLLTVNSSTGGTVTRDEGIDSEPTRPGTGFPRITLTAIPLAGYHFTNWSGDLSGTNNPVSPIVIEEMNITANFAKDMNLKVKASSPLGMKWYQSDWLGLFWQDSATNWIYHSGMGWLYVALIGDGSSYFLYSVNLGWVWTNANVFPYVYRSSLGNKQAGWLYFREGSAPPYFHDYATGTWSKLGE